jgi:hypothetical protein
MEERKRQGELKQLQEEGAAFVPTSPRSSLVPQVHEQFDRPWPMPRVMIVRERKDFSDALVDRRTWLSCLRLWSKGITLPGGTYAR